MLDFKKLRQDIKDVSQELKNLRLDIVPKEPSTYRLKVLHAQAEYEHQTELYRQTKGPVTPEWVKASKRLEILRWDIKKYATILCSIRAHHRGKVHAQKRRNPYFGMEGQPKFLYPTIADQEKLIELFWKDYEVQTETV